MNARRSRIPACAFALALSLAGCVTIGGRLDGARSVEEIARRTARYYVRDRKEPACVVAVKTDGREAVYAAEGEADETSIFRMASLTKLYLASVYLRLHDEGRLNLDASVSSSTRLPLPPEWDGVTLRDLLRNRSGLPREFRSWSFLFTACNCGFFGTHIYAGYEDRDTFLAQLDRDSCRAAVRAHREGYSNMGFGLLGICVEDTLGKSLEQILDEELVRPLGLRDTSFAPRGEMAARLTVARAGSLPFLLPRGAPVPDHRLGEMLRGTGGLYSSARDAVKVFTHNWPQFERFARLAPIDRLEEDAVWGSLRAHILPDGRRALYRAGMYYGGATFALFDPSTRTFLLILRNVTEWPDTRAFTVYDRIRAALQPAPSQP